MISEVTWANYWSAIIILLVIYYLLVIISYYSHEAGQILVGKRKLTFSPKSAKRKMSPENVIEHTLLFPRENRGNETESQKNDVLIPLADKLFEEISEIIGKQYIREELIMALQLKLSEYPQIVGADFQKGINNFIGRECEEKGSIHLSEDELRVLWNR